MTRNSFSSYRSYTWWSSTSGCFSTYELSCFGTTRKIHKQGVDYISKKKSRALKWRDGPFLWYIVPVHFVSQACNIKPLIKSHSVRIYSYTFTFFVFSDSTDFFLPKSMKYLQSPLHFFWFFLNDDCLQRIIDKSKAYAVQQDPNVNLNLGMTDVMRFIGICIYSSVVHSPNMRSYWKQKIRQTTVITATSQKEFERIQKFIHLNNNLNHDGFNRLQKIRPLLDSIRKTFQEIPPSERLLLDEQICTTKNRSYLKQYLPNKPKKWGYKFFCPAMN